MGLERAATRSLVSSSSPKLPIAGATWISNSSSSTIFGFFEVRVVFGALGLDFEVVPSNECAAASSFKTVVLDLGVALELWAERGVVLCVLFLMDLGIVIVSKRYFWKCHILVLVCVRSSRSGSWNLSNTIIQSIIKDVQHKLVGPYLVGCTGGCLLPLLLNHFNHLNFRVGHAWFYFCVICQYPGFILLPIGWC